ncbi:MAG: LPP20 family lipoprotein, partial [Gammaproteobacteria bacterium]|nr:LPP20 family lipoprotein [Gammaproteobacteria bacterium]
EDKDGDCPAGTVPFLATESGQNITNKTIVASGYGAPPARLLSDGQKRLLALRAAKLDAIRTLAERVSGMHIWGGATISDMALRSDRVHVQLDTFIRGARMIAMNYMNDGSYEAVMQVNFNRSVMKRLNINRCVPAGQAMNMRMSSL